MESIDYQNRKFKIISNSNVKDIGSNTIFSVCHSGDLVYGLYQGGQVSQGSFIAKLMGNGSLEKRFQHLNDKGHFISGKSYSTTEVLPDGRLRLKESWEFTPEIKGSAIFEEIKDKNDYQKSDGFSWQNHFLTAKDYPVYNCLLTK